jgi:ABC-type lipoprotein export system ATPase subunit
MAAQYAFVMKDMTKSFPGAQKPVLNHINLQFYHGAKIGIVGPNGAGKSTLMKIMAGIDKDFQGEAWPGENITVGYLPQEPQLDPNKNVLENVKDGARDVADMVDRFNAISAEMGDPKEDTDFDALMEEMGDLQAKIDAVDGWTLDSQLELAMEALRCPPSDWSVENLSGGEKRRIALTRLLIQKPSILLGKHVDFVDDIDLVACADASVADRVDDLADIVDAGMRRRVHLDHVDVPPLGNRPAGFADVARSDRGAAFPIRSDAVQRLGDETSGRGLADPADPGEEESMGDPPSLDGIGEGLHHCVLADQLGEGLGPVLAREHAVRRSSGWSWHFGQIEAQAGRFGVFHQH